MTPGPHNPPIFIYQVFCVAVIAIAVIWNKLNDNHRNQGE
jgi:hypothetical protein